MKPAEFSVLLASWCRLLTQGQVTDMDSSSTDIGLCETQITLDFGITDVLIRTRDVRLAQLFCAKSEADGVARTESLASL